MYTGFINRCALGPTWYWCTYPPINGGQNVQSQYHHIVIQSSHYHHIVIQSSHYHHITVDIITLLSYNHTLRVY